MELLHGWKVSSTLDIIEPEHNHNHTESLSMQIENGPHHAVNANDCPSIDYDWHCYCTQPIHRSIDQPHGMMANKSNIKRVNSRNNLT